MLISIEKSIEIQERWQNGDDITSFDDLNAAVKLGIEALKRVKAGRPAPPSLAYMPLEGETKE